MANSGERKLFKDWFDAALIDELSERLSGVSGEFSARRFKRSALPGLLELEMMGRVGQIADALNAALPTPTARALKILMDSMPSPAPEGDGVMDAGYRLWPYGEYIARYCLDDVDASFEAMVQLTMRFTSEFAVRPFIAADLQGSFKRLKALVKHPNHHVRRWVSEGTRSRLPWAKKIPELSLAIEQRAALLQALRHDPSRYVQRSVANHLQDLLKDDLPRGKELLSAWVKEDEPGLNWVTKHAARGLLKAGDAEVLQLFGYQAQEFELSAFKASAGCARIGESVRLSAELRSTAKRPLRLRVDYAWLSPTKTGREARKVFRFTELDIAPGETISLEKKHPFLHRTIRTIHPGQHRFELLVNGARVAEVGVEVNGAG